MNIFQAQLIIAPLEKRRIDIESRSLKSTKEINGILYENTLEDADLELLQNVEAEILQAFDELQSIPEIFNHIMMWNVEVEASYSHEGLTAKLLSRIENIEGVLSEEDPLAKKLFKIFNELSLKNMESSGGLGVWQLSVLLNTADANNLCQLLNKELSNEISAKKIILTRKYTRPFLEGLLSDDDVESFVAANPGLNYGF